MEAYLGSVFAFGFNFPPIGWALCNGQILSISQNELLFSLLGKTYGGDGVTTFGLPNLNGCVPVGTGQGPGLSNYTPGQTGGAESLTLMQANLPAHTHVAGTVQIPVSTAAGDASDPTNAYFAVANNDIDTAYSATTNATMAPNSGQTGIAGSSSPLDIRSPSLTVNYCICTQGFFPPQP